MTVGEILRCLESWAPPGIAWDRDNVGLQVGDARTKVKGILVALDPTTEVVNEARKRKANLIVTHHPLLFRPVKSVTPTDESGRTIMNLVEAGITLCSAHTNIDFTRGGTSFALASNLGLQDRDFLVKSYHNLKKVVTFVPIADAEHVAASMSRAGAGRIGNYEECSFRLEGVGTFRGNAKSNPTAGVRHQRETVREVRLEMLVGGSQLSSVLRAMKESHPYEEVAFDVYPLENQSDEYGMGVIGKLPRPMRLELFLKHVQRKLKTGALRYCSGPRREIRIVAVCGGSGADLTDQAIHQGADAFVTADVKYHGFHHARKAITLVDAGHFETEWPVVAAIVSRVQHYVKTSRSAVPVFATRTSTNPIQYV